MGYFFPAAPYLGESALHPLHMELRSPPVDCDHPHDLRQQLHGDKGVLVAWGHDEGDGGAQSAIEDAESAVVG